MDETGLKQGAGDTSTVSYKLSTVVLILSHVSTGVGRAVAQVILSVTATVNIADLVCTQYFHI